MQVQTNKKNRLVTVITATDAPWDIAIPYQRRITKSKIK